MVNKISANAYLGIVIIYKQAFSYEHFISRALLYGWR